MDKFSERLAELMDNENLASEALGARVGVDGSAVRLWQEGKSVFLSNMIKLAQYFHCSIDFLMGRTEKLLDFKPQPCLPFYTRLREVMCEQRVSTYRLCKDLGISSCNFTNWKNGTDPFIQTVELLANYLEVSIDFLVGRDR